MTNTTPEKRAKVYTYEECVDGLRFARRRKTKAFYANKLEMYMRLMVQERDELHAMLSPQPEYHSCNPSCKSGCEIKGSKQ